MLTSKDGQVIQESTIMSSYRETTGLLVSDVERAAGVGPRYVRVGCIGDGELSKDESEEGEPEASRREIHEGRGTRCPEGLGLEAKTGPGCQRELMSKREMDIFGLSSKVCRDIMGIPATRTRVSNKIRSHS